MRELPGFAILIGFTLIIGMVMGTVIDSLETDSGANSTAANISAQGKAGLTNLFSKFGLIGTIVGLAVVLGVVIGIFVTRGGFRGGGL